MATIETVNIADVYPLVDEYGNDMASRDYSMKVNQDYVRELARSMAQKGVPDEMVTLVRDGGIYRIKAGNSRVRAMRELGTKKFPAIIEDESTVQEVLETVIRTNTKKTYEPQEESCFVRQLALFASDEYVAEVTGIEASNVAKIRKAAAIVEDSADDMSLLRLITIGEFADNPEAVEALTNCKEREYPIIAKRFEARRAKEEAAKALLKEFAARNIEIVTDASGLSLIANVNKVSAIPNDLPEDCVAMEHNTPGFYMLLAPKSNHSPQKTEQDNSLQAEIEAMRTLYAEGTQRRRAWLAEQLQMQSILPTLSHLVEINENRHCYAVKKFMEATNMSRLNVGPGEIIALFEDMNGAGMYGILDFDGKPQTRACQRYTQLLCAMECDGYEPNEDEQEIYQQAIDHLEGTHDR